MEGSSAFQFGRAAYQAGLLEPPPADRRRLGQPDVPPARRHRRGHARAARPDLRVARGTRVRDLERLGADVLAGVLPRIYPQVLALAYEHQDAGRRVYIVTAASQELAEMLARVLALRRRPSARSSPRWSTASTPAGPTGLFIYGQEKARRDRAAGRARGPRPRRVLRLLGLGLGPADAPARRPPGGGQPRPGAAQRLPARSGWEVLRFDRLGRRLKAVGGAGGRRRSPAASGRRRWPPAARRPARPGRPSCAEDLPRRPSVRLC